MFDAMTVQSLNPVHYLRLSVVILYLSENSSLEIKKFLSHEM